jgi:hypothetical protein
MGQRLWKVLLGYDGEEQPWTGMRKEIWRPLVVYEECKNYNVQTTRVDLKINSFIMYGSKKLLSMDAWGLVAYAERGT